MHIGENFRRLNAHLRQKHWCTSLYQRKTWFIFCNYPYSNSKSLSYTLYNNIVHFFLLLQEHCYSRNQIQKILLLKNRFLWFREIIYMSSHFNTYSHQTKSGFNLDIILHGNKMSLRVSEALSAHLFFLSYRWCLHSPSSLIFIPSFPHV